MRIVYSFPDTLGAPGIGTTALNQVKGLIARGHEVLVYCTATRYELPGARMTTTLTVLGRRVPHRALGRERAYRYHDRRVARGLRRLRLRADVVHLWPRATVQTAAAAREVGTKSVREVPNTHTAYAYESVARETAALGIRAASGHSHTFDPAALALEEAEFSAVDALAVPSEFSKRTFLERGFDESRLLLHQYGFDPARFPVDGRPVDRSGDGLTVLFAGRCEPRKGLHHALRAWIDSGAAERGRFVICGDFFPGYREVLGAQLEHPSVEERGFEPDLAATMRDSDILVLPSVEEGSALVTYEAQASGCVLLVSDAAGARAEHMQGGLIHAAGDVAALTDHLRLLDRDRTLLARLREHTLARRAALTWDRAAEDLESIYETVRRG